MKLCPDKSRIEYIIIGKKKALESPKWDYVQTRIKHIWTKIEH